MNCDILFDRM